MNKYVESVSHLGYAPNSWEDIDRFLTYLTVDSHINKIGFLSYNKILFATEKKDDRKDDKKKERRPKRKKGPNDLYTQIKKTIQEISTLCDMKRKSGQYGCRFDVELPGEFPLLQIGIFNPNSTHIPILKNIGHKHFIWITEWLNRLNNPKFSKRIGLSQCYPILEEDLMYEFEKNMYQISVVDIIQYLFETYETSESSMLKTEGYTKPDIEDNIKDFICDLTYHINKNLKYSLIKFDEWINMLKSTAADNTHIYILNPEKFITDNTFGKVDDTVIISPEVAGKCFFNSPAYVGDVISDELNQIKARRVELLSSTGLEPVENNLDMLPKYIERIGIPILGMDIDLYHVR